MTAVDRVAAGDESEGGLLSRERTVAQAGFNRWLVPPAALAIHLCIGMAYALSVFWLPLSNALPNVDKEACKNIGFVDLLTTTSCNWTVDSVKSTFEIGIVILGLSAALFGGWLERAGPRKAGVVAAICWGGGFLLSAVAVHIHQLWLLYLGLGFFGGIGLGLGYISPVSTLIKWFPDHRGMATGMAIMGFGGGAMIGAPLANLLINTYKGPGQVGVWQTFATLGVVYLIAMLIGAFGYRVPPENWIPEGWVDTLHRKKNVTHGNVHLDDAHKTPSFWFIWGVLFLNVSAGIAVLAMASPMLQEIFAGKLIGQDIAFGHLSATQKTAVAGIAAGFVGLLSLFNIGGRFFWASISDFIGRKATYFTFFILGILLYASAPSLGHAGSKVLFVGAICIIISMYGGGFATVPAYLADIFGTKYVGAIHGRLLTAWSAAGVVGSEVIGRVRESQIKAGVAKALVYDTTMYIMVGLLVAGLICNLLVRPVDDKWLMTDDGASDQAKSTGNESSQGIGRGGLSGAVLVPWLLIAIPVAWGLYKALLSAAKILS